MIYLLIKWAVKDQFIKPLQLNFVDNSSDDWNIKKFENFQSL